MVRVTGLAPPISHTFISVFNVITPISLPVLYHIYQKTAIVMALFYHFFNH